MQLKPTASLYLDLRKQLKDKKFMLKLRVNFDKGGKQLQKYYSTGFTLSEDDWKRFKSESVPRKLQKAREHSVALLAKANDILKDSPRIKPETFAAILVGKYNRGSSASALYDEIIAQMESEGRIGNADAYRNSLKSLKKHRGEFSLEDVDVDFLQQYEKEMIEAGETITTVGFYLRALRAVLNVAIDKKKMLSRDAYPFGKGGYTIRNGSSYKRALKKDDKVKLEKLKPKIEQERRALAMWLFSYYCNGMNFADMAYLRASNIHDEVISFVRRKTMRTVREKKPIIVPIRDEVRTILAKYGTHEPYCFGIINDEMTAKEQFWTIKQWTKLTNKYVNQVAKAAGISGKVNTYAARHTFATMLLKGKADLKAIQQSLGHRSISTTEAYLADLDLDEAKEISKLL